MTDGAGGSSYAVPGVYFTYARAPKLLASISPGRYPKFCGLELVRSEHFLDDWQGDAITCDFRAHRIVRFDISEKGSTYVAQEMPDVLRSPSVTFRPIDVKMGPTARFISPTGRTVIQHGESISATNAVTTFMAVSGAKKGRPVVKETDLTNWAPRRCWPS